MKLEYLILGEFKLNPGTGYDFKKFLDTEGRYGRARAPLSQIYNTLKRMTKSGWLTFEEIPQEGKPNRKVYSVTAEGFEVLLEWLSAPHEPDFRFQDRIIFTKILYSCFLDDETILSHLRTDLAYRKDYIARFRHRDRTKKIDPASGVDAERLQAVYDQVHNYGSSALDLYVEHLEGIIDHFEKQIEKEEEYQ